ncbi:hypothetical protein I3843_08G152300 [Carya illinoinensis]|uniref:Calmodulin-binding protein n=1 Tax=Carya illinoinensis TaxID=32201 RepID=A0A8T1PS62_CARIL|nr:protein SAR DEFICIENT 1-like [Carya illinoinensis]XP_042990719.1 protein SAR DEFICIENT 1-like [Carya illinoinensis]XP_042990720.1 protein SAR DEFICIENT 1-like [Carya illinoinensis]KAG6645925.1 hypothetical protein CIPAW_08G157100 [Carya illinoinensis]KAG6645926.1 hypothetical protein CIPAW_08G157100 [Carya illinoinensis]KAG6645927.1 hypothetical protein CIPAW_08G157100 [Carya illinoinensis]KAG7968408.1 hypothetical protein I3843_08G152300 [Carya illinoinensis]
MAPKRMFDHEDNEDFGRSTSRRVLPIWPFRRAISEREFQIICEPFVRKVVRGEVERILQLQPEPCPRRELQLGATSGVRSLHLRFVNCLPSTIYTNNVIKSEDGNPIRIELIDTRSRTRVKSGPLSSIKLDIGVLDGGFQFDDQEDWTEQEYNASILREREGKRPLVVGNLKVTLAEGVGDVGEIHFTDNSSWVKSRKFILGAKVEKKHSGEGNIREARSQSFMVKDHRGELNKKHKTPSKSDEVWRLKNIAKDGPNHKRLTDSGIETIDHLLWLYAMDPSSVRKIFDKFSDGRWEKVIEQAMACVENDCNLYAYHGAEEIGLRFNSIYQVVEAAFDGHNYLPVQTLTSDQKRVIEVVKQQAYKNINDWVLVDDPSAYSFSRPSRSLQDEPFSIPEQGLPQVDFQFKHEDQQQTWQSFNNTHPSNSLMDNIYIGCYDGEGSVYNGEGSVLPSVDTTVPDISQFRVPNCGTQWGQGTDLISALSNKKDCGKFPLANNAGKPKVAWGIIRAAAKWCAVWRCVASRRMARPIFNY